LGICIPTYSKYPDLIYGFSCIYFSPSIYCILFTLFAVYSLTISALISDALLNLPHSSSVGILGVDHFSFLLLGVHSDFWAVLDDGVLSFLFIPLSTRLFFSYSMNKKTNEKESCTVWDRIWWVYLVVLSFLILPILLLGGPGRAGCDISDLMGWAGRSVFQFFFYLFWRGVGLILSVGYIFARSEIVNRGVGDGWYWLANALDIDGGI